MQWIGQKDQYGCGFAALAMITDQSYDDIATYFADSVKGSGATIFTWDQYLTEHGFAIARKYRGYMQREREDWPPKPFGDIHLCEVVVSQNSPCAHMVVMLKDGSVLDPLSPEPRRLTDYFKVHNVAAVIPATLLGALEKLSLQLNGDDCDYDSLLSLMCRLAGYCGTHAILQESYQTNTP